MYLVYSIRKVYNVCMASHTVRLDEPTYQAMRRLVRQLSVALDDDLTQSDAIGVSVGYALANPETLVQWARDQHSKGSDH